MANDVTTLKSRMESINDSINNMIDEIIHDAMKEFEFSEVDMIDSKLCMYTAKSVNLLKDSMKLYVEACAELDNMKESLDEIKHQNDEMKKELHGLYDLLREIKSEKK